MLLAIKLLVLLGVLSYAVSAVLAEQSLSMAFQAPLSRYLARRGGDQHEDSLTLSVSGAKGESCGMIPLNPPGDILPTCACSAP
jgi:hypothetical protein